ncbi:MAG: leucine-rich repeat protein [Oscillospiraceae bacterium]
MLNRKFLISLTLISSLLTINFNTLNASAFAGYDDNYSYNNGNSYGNYIFGQHIDEDNAVQVVTEEKVEEKKFTDLYYTINKEEVTITGVNEDLNFTYYSIPSTIEGYPVTTIGENAFKDCTQLVGLTVPNTVKTVNAYAFSGCTKLETIYFEDGSSKTSSDSNFDTSLDDGSYSDSTFPEVTTVSSIYGYDISQNDVATTTSQSVENASQEDTKKEVTIDKSGLRNIMEHAFDKCSNLDNIVVPSSLTFMGAYAIEDTPYYTSRIENGKNVILGSVFYKYNPEYTYSYEYNDLTSKYEPVVKPFEETIPDGIVSISYSAFENVEGLTTLKVPDTLKTIYDYAFANCPSLTTIEFSNGIEYVGNNAFINTPWLDECENGFAILGDYLYKYVGKGGSITVPSKVRIIGSEAFALNSSITRVEVPTGVQKIMGGAFYRCENLQTVVIAKDVLSIGNQAFYGCKNLTKITLSEGLLSIGSKCFISCDSLKYIIIPDSVTKIGDMALGFDYDSTRSSYSLIDGFTIVASENSMAQKYAEVKMVGFSLKENFTIPEQVKTYEVDISDNDDKEQQPLDKAIIIKVISALVGLLILLSLGLYIKDRITNPKKYKKKKRKKKKRSKKNTKTVKNTQTQDSKNSTK